MKPSKLIALTALAPLVASCSLAIAQERKAAPLERVQLSGDTQAVQVVDRAEPANEQPFMGVAIGADTKNGVEIGQVYDKTGAAKAGLKAGDIIRRVADKETPNGDALIAAIRSHKIGDQVAVVVDRKGKEKLFLVSLGARPDTGSTAQAESSKSGSSLFRWSQGGAKGLDTLGEEIEIEDFLVLEGDSDLEGTLELKQGKVLFKGKDGQKDTWLHVSQPEEEPEEESHDGWHRHGDGEWHTHEHESKDLERLIDEARAKAKNFGKVDLQWHSGGESEEIILKRVHEILEKHVGDSPERGKAYVSIKLVTPDGEHAEEYEFEVGKEAHAGQAKHKAWSGEWGQGKTTSLYPKAKAEHKPGKQNQAKAGGESCCDCGCPCADQGSKATGQQAQKKRYAKAQQIKAKQAKQKQAKAKKAKLKQKKAKQAKAKREQAKKRMERERTVKRNQAKRRAQTARKKAEQRAQQAHERAESARRKAAERAKRDRDTRRSRRGSSDLESMRAELEEMRKQLEELRRSLRDMHEQMGGHGRSSLARDRLNIETAGGGDPPAVVLFGFRRMLVARLYKSQIEAIGKQPGQIPSQLVGLASGVPSVEHLGHGKQHLLIQVPFHGREGRPGASGLRTGGPGCDPRGSKCDRAPGQGRSGRAG